MLPEPGKSILPSCAACERGPDDPIHRGYGHPFAFTAAEAIRHRQRVAAERVRATSPEGAQAHIAVSAREKGGG